MNKYIYWKGWVLLIVLLVLALLSLNYILRLPVIIPVIGDENTWLPIMANGVFTVVAVFIGVILQKQYTQKIRDVEHKKEMLKMLLNKKREQVQQLKLMVEKNFIVLNIDPILLGFISEYNPAISATELISKILKYKQELIECKNLYDMNYKSDRSTLGKVMYSRALEEMVPPYIRCMDAAVSMFNQHNDLQTQFVKADTLQPNVNDSDKLMISITKVAGYEGMQKQKENLLNVHKQQKSNMDKLYSALKVSSEQLLNDENQLLQKLEKELEEIN